MNSDFLPSTTHPHQRYPLADLSNHSPLLSQFVLLNWIAQKKDEAAHFPIELLPLCRGPGLTLVYGVKHHRYLKDDLSIKSSTKKIYKQLTLPISP